MADHNKTGRSKKSRLPWESCHVEINNGFRQERAWKALNASARVVYIEIKSLYNGFNNGKVMASERHLAGLTGFSKNTISKALINLQDAGFIVEMKRGVIGVAGKGTGSLWRLTELGCLGDRPTKDFKKWQPKNRIPGQKLTQGGSEVDPVNAASGSEVDPGWVKNEPRKGPNSTDPWVNNGPNLIDVPCAPAEPRPATLSEKGEFLGATRKSTTPKPKRARAAQT